MLVFTIAFFAALVSLITGKQKADSVLTGALEVGVVLTGITLATGSIFATHLGHLVDIRPAPSTAQRSCSSPS